MNFTVFMSFMSASRAPRALAPMAASIALCLAFSGIARAEPPAELAPLPPPNDATPAPAATVQPASNPPIASVPAAGSSGAVAPAPAPFVEALSPRVASRTAPLPWRMEVGLRESFVGSAGYDPFSKNDRLAQFSLGIQKGLVARNAWRLSIGVHLDTGSASATARGQSTELELDRVSAPIEVQYRPWDFAYAFVRVAPGALALQAKIDDGGAPAALRMSRWRMTGDVSVGIAAPLGEVPALRDRSLRFGLMGEAGYSVAPTTQLRLTPDLPSDDPRRTATTDLGSLSLGGAFFRLTAIAEL